MRSPNEACKGLFLPFRIIVSSSGARALFLGELSGKRSIVLGTIGFLFLWSIAVNVGFVDSAPALWGMLDIVLLVGLLWPILDVLEERENGTLDWLRSLPIQPLELVCGKFMTATVIAWILMVAGFLSALPGLSLSVVRRGVFFPFGVFLSIGWLPLFISAHLWVAFRIASCVGIILWIILQLGVLSILFLFAKKVLFHWRSVVLLSLPFTPLLIGFFLQRAARCLIEE